MLETLVATVLIHIAVIVIKLVAMTDVAIHMYKLHNENYHTIIWLHSQIIIFNLFIMKSYLLLRSVSGDILNAYFTVVVQVTQYSKTYNKQCMQLSVI